MNTNWLFSAILRGNTIQRMITHGAQCGNGCLCKGGPPATLVAVDQLLCQGVLDFLCVSRLMMIGNEVTLPGNIRPDFICRNHRGEITIIELKTGYRKILQNGGNMKQMIAHLAQACSYAVTWNQSSLKGEYGPCTQLLLHYPDVDRKPWIEVHPAFWPEYAPLKPQKAVVVRAEDIDPNAAVDEEGNPMAESAFVDAMEAEQEAPEGVRRSGRRRRVRASSLHVPREEDHDDPPRSQRASSSGRRAPRQELMRTVQVEAFSEEDLEGQLHQIQQRAVVPRSQIRNRPSARR
jgi:hypothetical protein